MALVFSTQSPAYYQEFCQHMAQIKLNTLQIVLMANYENLLIQIILMAHICWKGTIQIKDMFQIVATWLQFSTKEYISLSPWMPFFKLHNTRGGNRKNDLYNHFCSTLILAVLESGIQCAHFEPTYVSFDALGLTLEGLKVY